MPQSRAAFWQSKLARNVERDMAAATALEKMGWHVAVIWECETKNREIIKRLLRRILSRRALGN